MRKPPDGTPPRLAATVAGGLSALPRHEPILDDLLELRAFNERVERVNDIVETARDTITRLAPLPPDLAAYAERNQEATEQAKTEFAYATYIQLKLHSVVDRFAELACEVCHFPPDSNHAFFVHDALAEWARTRQLLQPEIKPTEQQIEFLQAFDLGYAERRLRFVVHHLNSLYGQGVDRDAVNKAKEIVYGLVAELSRAAGEAGGGGRGDAVRSLFTPERIGSLIDSERPPDQVVEQFVNDHGDDLDRMREGLRSFFDERLGDFGDKGYGYLLEATEGWDDATRRDVLARYVGFPLWDVLIFPIRAVSDVGELNRVEVVRFSPEDVKLLTAPDQKCERPTTEEKLKGVAAGHFAAFFSRDRRENDYLWGRLDGVERLMGLLLGDPPVDLCHSAFAAVLDQEEPNLEQVPELMSHLRSQLRQG